MTREQLNKWWPLIVAYKEGKQIQGQARSGDWYDEPEPCFIGTNYVDYRIKPDRWAEVRAAYERGEKCQVRIKLTFPVSGKQWGPWTDVCTPQFLDDPDVEYRVVGRWATVRDAYERGERCQMRCRYHAPGYDCWGKWQDEINPAFPDDPDIDFRIAPVKRCRPFTAEEVPIGRVVVGKHEGKWMRPSERRMITDVAVNVGLGGWRCTLDALLDYCVFEDGTPCGVEVEE